MTDMMEPGCSSSVRRGGHFTSKSVKPGAVNLGVCPQDVPGKRDRNMLPRGTKGYEPPSAGSEHAPIAVHD